MISIECCINVCIPMLLNHDPLSQKRIKRNRRHWFLIYAKQMRFIMFVIIVALSLTPAAFITAETIKKQIILKKNQKWMILKLPFALLHNEAILIVRTHNKGILVVGIHNQGILIVVIHNEGILIVWIHDKEFLIVQIHNKGVLIGIHNQGILIVCISQSENPYCVDPYEGNPHCVDPQ